MTPPLHIRVESLLAKSSSIRKRPRDEEEEDDDADDDDDVVVEIVSPAKRAMFQSPAMVLSQSSRESTASVIDLTSPNI